MMIREDSGPACFYTYVLFVPEIAACRGNEEEDEGGGWRDVLGDDVSVIGWKDASTIFQPMRVRRAVTLPPSNWNIAILVDGFSDN